MEHWASRYAGIFCTANCTPELLTMCVVPDGFSPTRLLCTEKVHQAFLLC